MAVDIRRLKPNRTTLTALVGVLFAVSLGAARDFVWADVRDGLVRTEGLPRITRALIRVGFVLLVVMVGAMLFNEILRGEFPLIAAVSGTVGRGVLLPTALLPFTMFMIAIAWSFLLTGALHSHPALRIAVVVAYLGTTVGWLSGGIFTPTGVMLVAWAALAAVPLLFAVRWRGEIRPAIEYPIVLVLVGTAYAIGHSQLVATYQASGTPLFLQTLEGTILQLGALVTPLLVLIGMDVADFAYRAGTWTVAVVSTRMGKVVLGIVTTALIAWQLRNVIADAISRVGNGETLGYAGALGMPLLVAATYWAVTRLDRDTSDDDRSPEAIVEEASGNAGRLAFGFFGWELLLTVVVFTLLAVIAIAGTAAGSLLFETYTFLSGFTSQFSQAWRIGFDVVVALLGLYVARRGRHVIGLYLTLVGVLDGWILLTSAGAPLAALVWNTRTPVTFWWVAAIAVAAIGLTLTRRMSAGRAEGLLLMTVMTVLVGGAEAIEDPFSPFFAFAGVGLIAFGIIWDSLTVGTWANADSAAIPRPNRMLLYLGYVLFSVTVINWALTTHDLSDVEFFTGGVSQIGFQQFGVPLVYALYALLLAKVLGRNRETPTAEGSAPSA